MKKWQTRETLAVYTTLQTNGKEKNGTKSKIEGVHSSIYLENKGLILPSWIQILLLAALNILLDNKPG